MGRRIWAVAVSTLVLTAVAGWSVTFGQTADEPQPSTKEATTLVVTIDYGDGAQRRYSAVPCPPKQTVLDATRWAAEHPRGFDLKYRGQGETAFVTQIDNLKNQDDKDRSWIYRVNEKLGDRSSGIRSVKPGDQIVWKFQKYE